VIPLDKLWEQYRRIIKPKGAIVLFGSEPFSTMLRSSNLKGYCYDWIWDKVFGGNFVQAERQPIKTHEIISVFSKSGQCPTYYPQKIKRDVPIKAGGNTQKDGKAIKLAVTSHSEEFGKMHKVYDEKFPESQLRFSCRAERGLHPTQKPVDLLRYLVLTYTNEGDTVLDNCMGSGTTAIACIKEKRHFIGFEKDETYWKKSVERVKNEQRQLTLF
jgi:site-specific DNA-methyltransferase (adenine-specific)